MNKNGQKIQRAVLVTACDTVLAFDSKCIVVVYYAQCFVYTSCHQSQRSLGALGNRQGCLPCCNASGELHRPQSSEYMHWIDAHE